MPKPITPKTKLSKIIIPCIIIAVLATSIIVAVVMLAARTQAPGSSVSTTLSGEFVCLPHKNTSGPQTMECAYGLHTDDNRFYALELTQDMMFNIETNKRVEVSGTLTTDRDSIYDIVGTLKVESYHY